MHQIAVINKSSRQFVTKIKMIKLDFAAAASSFHDTEVGGKTQKVRNFLPSLLLFNFFIQKSMK